MNTDNLVAFGLGVLMVALFASYLHDRRRVVRRQPQPQPLPVGGRFTEYVPRYDAPFSWN